MPVQNIVDCTGNITGGKKKDAKFVAESFFDPMNDLYPEKKLVDLHMFDAACVCRKSQKTLKVVYPILSFIVGSEHTCHNVFKGWESIEEMNKLCIEDTACRISAKNEIRGITISNLPFILTSPTFVPPYIGPLPPLGNIKDLWRKLSFSTCVLQD